MEKISELVEEIAAAWSGALPPAPSNISMPTYDDEGVAAYFAGKTWRGHTAKKLRLLSFAPGILTHQAFAYFLPAYMKADLEEPEVADTIVESLLFGLAGDGAPCGRSDAVLALLSRPQKLALANYVRFVQQRENGLYMKECGRILQCLDS